MGKAQKNSSIEIARFISALLVTSIHAHIFREESPLLYYVIPMGIARIGVPFFLIVAGYFFYDRLQAGRETRSYFLKLLKTWVIFSVAEVAIAGWYYYPAYGTLGSFMHRIVAVGLGDAYWYLWTLPVSLLLLMPLWKKKVILPGLAAGLLLFLFSLTNDSYSFLFSGTKIQELGLLHQRIFFWTGAGFLSTILFLSAGAFFSSRKENVNQFAADNRAIVFVVLIIGLAAVMAESYFTMEAGCNDSMNKFSLLIAAPTVFLFTLAYPCNNEKFNFLGSLSFHMYLVHPIILDITNMISLSSVPKYLVAVTGSVIYAVVAVKVQKKSRSCFDRPRS